MAKPKKNLAPKKTKAQAKIEELQQKVQDPKYAHQKYEAGTMVTIPATLFADFLNSNNEGINFLIQLRRTLGAVVQALDISIAREDAMTLNLMEQHIVNVDSGLTKALSPEEFQAMVNPQVPTEEAPTAEESTIQENPAN